VKRGVRIQTEKRMKEKEIKCRLFGFLKGGLGIRPANVGNQSLLPTSLHFTSKEG
jgi:hypothetical protein